MTFNDNYILRKIAGETLLVHQGTDGIDMTKVIALNNSGTFLYNLLSKVDFTANDASLLLADEYGISPQEAANDVDNWINTLKNYGAICE